MTTAEVSHGRGGAGNINHDETKYIDGEIVRSGTPGSQGAGAFSTGRGGDGNIGDKHVSPTARTDVDVVPDVATRIPEEEDVHTGRGGAGNVKLLPEHQHKKVVDGVPHDGASTSHGSVADKLKHKVLGLFK